jgi:hypothetical protein
LFERCVASLSSAADRRPAVDLFTRADRRCSRRGRRARYAPGHVGERAAALVIDVATSGAKLALKCKREKLAVGAKCNDRKAKPIDVLSCYHVDFATPMPFAPPPGIEYRVDATCNGYRLIAP